MTLCLIKIYIISAFQQIAVELWSWHCAVLCFIWSRRSYFMFHWILGAMVSKKTFGAQDLWKPFPELAMLYSLWKISGRTFHHQMLAVKTEVNNCLSTLVLQLFPKIRNNSWSQGRPCLPLLKEPVWIPYSRPRLQPSSLSPRYGIKCYKHIGCMLLASSPTTKPELPSDKD